MEYKLNRNKHNCKMRWDVSKMFSKLLRSSHLKLQSLDDEYMFKIMEDYHNEKDGSQMEHLRNNLCFPISYCTVTKGKILETAICEKSWQIEE